MTTDTLPTTTKNLLLTTAQEDRSLRQQTFAEFILRQKTGGELAARLFVCEVANEVRIESRCWFRGVVDGRQLVERQTDRSIHQQWQELVDSFRAVVNLHPDLFTLEQR